ncbi:Triosephosphate isomerase [Candidatus Cyrtobacter comes]|uniref:Triosephosphate isomerase n=2 Tax=Candidatus Cyrtobacter comes TaxID=675776 RepID=A0ABU5L6L1_9RICK|nr:Triosephosphate isomerase [Candidatus Cyrtobacter comes]
MNLVSVQTFMDNFSTLNINHNNAEIIICPSVIHIPILKDYNLSYVNIGAQDCSIFQNFGAQTGEVCASMLAELGVKYVILGHCERRYLGENEDMILSKIDASLKANIIPIVCFGEDEHEHLTMDTWTIVQQKLSFLKGLNHKNTIVIAYEPIWSIGSGKIPDNLYINSILTHAKQYLKDDGYLFVYGGSVTAKNARDILKISDGLLIGSASLEVTKLYDIMMCYHGL